MSYFGGGSYSKEDVVVSEDLEMSKRWKVII